MSANTMELAKGRDTVAALLEELGLDAYLFEVEPRTDTTWELQLECAVAGGWERVVVPVEREPLLRCLDDAKAREALRAQLGERLRACTLRSP